MIYLKNKELLAVDNSAQIFNILSTLPASLDDVDVLLKVVFNSSCTVAPKISVTFHVLFNKLDKCFDTLRRWMIALQLTQ